MACQLVIFDFDGTLADTFGWFAAALNKAALRFGFRTLSDADVTMLRGCSNREIIRFLGVPLWKVPLIANHLRHLAAAEAASIRLFPGTGEMLHRLHGAGVRLAIVSSNAEATIRQALGEELAARIDVYECGASLFGKAARFRRVLRRTGIPASAAIAIGDEGRDVDAARRTGIAAGAVTWGYATPDFLLSCQPDALFRSMADLADEITGRSPARVRSATGA